MSVALPENPTSVPNTHIKSTQLAVPPVAPVAVPSVARHRRALDIFLQCEWVMSPRGSTAAWPAWSRSHDNAQIRGRQMGEKEKWGNLSVMNVGELTSALIFHAVAWEQR